MDRGERGLTDLNTLHVAGNEGGTASAPGTEPALGAETARSADPLAFNQL